MGDYLAFLCPHLHALCDFLCAYHYLPAILLVYVSLSVFFFKYPHLLHGKRFQGQIWDFLENHSQKQMFHISHRGGSRENLENTLEAFDYAVNVAKTDMLEFDVFLTKDKKVVVFHDQTLTRMMGQDKHIEDYNYSELPEFL